MNVGAKIVKFYYGDKIVTTEYSTDQAYSEFDDNVIIMEDWDEIEICPPYMEIEKFKRDVYKRKNK